MMEKSLIVDCLTLSIVCGIFAVVTVAEPTLLTCAEKFWTIWFGLEVPIGLEYMEHEDMRSNCSEFKKSHERSFKDFNDCGGFQVEDMEPLIFRYNGIRKSDAYERRKRTLEFCDNSAEPKSGHLFRKELLKEAKLLFTSELRECVNLLSAAVEVMFKHTPWFLTKLSVDERRFVCEESREILARAYQPKCQHEISTILDKYDELHQHRESKKLEESKKAKSKDPRLLLYEVEKRDSRQILWLYKECLFGNYAEGMELTDVFRSLLGIVNYVPKEDEKED